MATAPHPHHHLYIFFSHTVFLRDSGLNWGTAAAQSRASELNPLHSPREVAGVSSWGAGVLFRCLNSISPSVKSSWKVDGAPKG